MKSFLSWFIQTQTVRGIFFIILFLAVFILNFFHLMPADYNLRFLLTVVLLLAAGLIVFFVLHSYYNVLHKENEESIRKDMEKLQKDSQASS